MIIKKLCKVPHKRKFHEAPCHKPDKEKVIITGSTIESKKLKFVKFSFIENLKNLIAMFVKR